MQYASLPILLPQAGFLGYTTLWWFLINFKPVQSYNCLETYTRPDLAGAEFYSGFTFDSEESDEKNFSGNSMI